MNKYRIILSVLIFFFAVSGPVLMSEDNDDLEEIDVVEETDVDFEALIEAEEAGEEDEDAGSGENGESGENDENGENGESGETSEPGDADGADEVDPFAGERFEDRFPVTFQVPDGWLGEYTYDADGDPYIIYLRSLTDHEVAVRVQYFPSGLIDEPEETYLEYVIEATVDEGAYDAIEHELIQGDDFLYAKIDIAATNEEGRIFQTRFYRVLEDHVMMFQTYVYDVENLEYVDIVEQMFLSQEVEEPADTEVPDDWTTNSLEKATFNHPEDWEFEDTLRPNELPSITYSGDDEMIFDLFADRFDEGQLQTPDDYIRALEMYAEILSAEYAEYEIYSIDISFADDITLKMRSHGMNPAMDTLTDVQIFAVIDARDDTIYTMILELPTDKELTEKPDVQHEELFKQLVQGFDIAEE